MSHLHPNRSDSDEIYQKYLDRAIGQINELAGKINACDLCRHAPDFTPVLGTGHPLADVFMVKHRPRGDELDEGVAFFGRAGQAVLASIRRLNVDPLDLYGTVCIKCTGTPTDCELESCPAWLAEEIAIVEPKLLIVMGAEALETVNDLDMAEARVLEFTPGRLQRWTAGCDALICPDIDESLDAPASKTAFWDAFRQLGDWYADKPPF